EEVEDPVLLEQSAQEAQVVLVILYTIVARRVGPEQLEAVPAAVEPGGVEHLLDDVGRGHVLEDPAIAAEPQAPQPRHDHGLIELEVSRLPDVIEGGADPRDQPRRLAAADLEGHRRIDDLAEVDLG